MSSGPLRFGELRAADVEVLLCDADGNLFPSEDPAFVASAEVANRLLADVGVERRYTPVELRRAAVGRNFRSTALELAARHGVALDPLRLERYVQEEKREVIAHLGRVLSADPDVLVPLTRLARRFRLAAVSSSASSRLDACFRATGLTGLFVQDVRFSAEDSLAVPTSKPDPAIYTFAGEALGVSGDRALAIEDATAGVRSAVAAGFPAVGNLMFIAPDEREDRAAALREAGAVAIVGSWWELAELLGVAPAAATGAGAQ
jgi:beta-phosphoglucomutase-like phosphatase (HAD superfamily)